MFWELTLSFLLMGKLDRMVGVVEGGKERGGQGVFQLEQEEDCSQGAWSHSCLLMGAGVPRYFHHWHRLS